MQKKKSRVIQIITVFAAVLFTASIALYFIFVPKFAVEAESGYEIKNVILFIGDGMGFNHIENTKIHSGKDALVMESLPFNARVKTRSKYLVITDSAAAATALATGTKTRNRQIGKDNGKTLKNISEYAMDADKSVGVLTTDNLYGATPAGFSAHAADRGQQETIIESQIKSGIDLFIGKGSSAYKTYESKMSENGYIFCEDYSAMTSLSDAEKLFAALNGISPAEITLKMMVEFALDFLSRDTDGFFLMAEGANIDKRSHENKIFEMIDELLDFDLAIEYAMQWAEARKDTAVIVTADHETGGLRVKDAVSNDNYRYTGHTSADVPVFMLGVSANKKRLDNTQIFLICKEMLKV